MSLPIPIAFGITDLDVGGAEKMLVALATGLDRTRWSPSVVCLQPRGTLAERLTLRGIPVESLDIRSAADLPWALWQWRRILRQQRTRLLQTFLVHANVLGRLAGRWARVPKIISGVRVADRRTQMIHRLDRWTAGWSDLHICVSSGVRDFTADALRLPDDKFTVIPNGVVPPAPEEPAVDLCQRLGIISKGRIATLLFVGRLDLQKGLEDLLSALAELNADQTLSKRLRVVCVGTGPSEAKLKQQTQSMGLQQVVHWAGWQADAVSWMRAADGLVLPSRWEGMPNVVLEAMAVGCPVIATAVEGTREVLEEGKTGWLVPPGRPEMLASAIQRFLDAPDLRREFGQNGREVVRTKFTIDRMVAAYEACYLELLGQGRVERGPAER